MDCPKCKSAKTRKLGTTQRKGIRAQQYRCNTCGHFWRDYNRTATTYRRIIFVQDTHCGHLTGLTPTEFQINSMPFADFRAESWLWFNNVIELMKPFDYAVYNGDLIDGSQHKNGGRELLYADQLEQVRMMVSIHNKISPVKSIVIKGTPYHTGQVIDFEKDFADRIGSQCYDRFLGDIAGKVFDIRHKIGRSSVPHGRMTPLSRQVLWSRLRDERSGVKADVIIRSHVHYHIYMEESGIIAFTTPALQGHSDYGAMQCDGETDYGIVILDIYNDGRILKHSFFPELESMKTKIEEI